MRIVGNPSLPGAVSVQEVDGATRPAAPSASVPEAAGLASDVLKPAQTALKAMPDIDQAKVAALRDALANGEITFDAQRLARLVQRFHGGQG